MTYEMACEQYQREADYWIGLERAAAEELENYPEDYEGMDEEEAFERAIETVIERARDY